MPVERVPRTLLKKDQDGSVSIAEPMPRKPPPARKYFSNAASCAESRTSPVVFRNTTALYEASPASVNLPASADTSNVASAGAEACRAATPSAAPTVAFLVKTSTLYGSAACADVAPAAESDSVATAVVSPMRRNTPGSRKRKTRFKPRYDNCIRFLLRRLNAG